jgi:hypothetical protein
LYFTDILPYYWWSCQSLKIPDPVIYQSQINTIA